MDVTIPARDGFGLAATVHQSAVDSRGPVVVVGSALGVRRQFYAPFAAFLAQRGIPAVTYDYRGIGGSRPTSLRGFESKMHEWATEDAAGVLEWTLKEFPGRPVVLVGHSAGGWLVGLTPNADKYAAIVTVASQSGHWRLWDGWHQARLWAVWNVVLPVVARAFGYVPGRLGLGQDVPKGVILEWATWGRSRGFVRDDPAVPSDAYARLRFPALILGIEDDHDYAPKRAVDTFASWFTGAEVERRTIPAPMGHFGFFREKVGAGYWPGLADWILANAAPVVGR